MKKKRDIEPEEERFLRGLMEGKSQREAYKEAYPHRSHWKPKTIDTKASELFNRGEIKGRYEEMKQEARDAGAITTTRIVNRLRDFVDAPLDLEKLRPADQLKAMEMMCRLLGLYPPPYDDD